MTVLYLGSDPSRYAAQCKKKVTHFPLLEIVPRPLDAPQIAHVLDELPFYTHCIFTSKHAALLLVKATSKDLLASMKVIAIGASTAAALEKEGISPALVAEEEIQEGIIARLRLLPWKDDDYVLMPRSSLSRSALENFFTLRGIRHQVCDLYDTRPRCLSTLPPLDDVEEIVFTSPSTVHAFRLLYPTPPPHKQLTPIGPVTAEALRLYTHGQMAF